MCRCVQMAKLEANIFLIYHLVCMIVCWSYKKCSHQIELFAFTYFCLWKSNKMKLVTWIENMKVNRVGAVIRSCWPANQCLFDACFLRCHRWCHCWPLPTAFLLSTYFPVSWLLTFTVSQAPQSSTRRSAIHTDSNIWHLLCLVVVHSLSACLFVPDKQAVAKTRCTLWYIY